MDNQDQQTSVEPFTPEEPLTDESGNKHYIVLGVVALVLLMLLSLTAIFVAT